MYEKRPDLQPKLFTYAANGYDLDTLKKDFIAGLTVAIVALPLSMAIAIASGVSPNIGLQTAFVAGFWISFLGGSRFQIGGPTAAFALVVANIIHQHGLDGLFLATLIAGIILAAAGFLKLGVFLKFIPNSVVIGFTTGIAITIFITQIPNFSGINPHGDYTDISEKIISYIEAWQSINPVTIGLSLGSLGLLIGLKKFYPKLPAFLILVILASLIAGLLNLSTQTFGDKFGMIETRIPDIKLPNYSWAMIKDVLPSSLTIAFLAGIESLLSAVVADGMTGSRHRPNAELLAQGVANILSAVTGGLPATGAIARTATNIRAGAKTPVAGVLHATILLVLLLIAGKLTSYIPLAALSAILMIVAWNMAEIEKLIRFFKVSNLPDRVILMITLLLTVFADLTLAVGIGVVLSAIFLMHKLSASFEVGNENDDKNSSLREHLPKNCELFHINGPLFFGAVNTFVDSIENIAPNVDYLLLDMNGVPFMDASGLSAMNRVFNIIKKRNGRIVFYSTKESIAEEIKNMAFATESEKMIDFAADFDEAIAKINNPTAKSV